MGIAEIMGIKITPQEEKRQTEEEFCIDWRDRRYFAASCPRLLKAMSAQLEINL
jgi:hypothetical protein